MIRNNLMISLGIRISSMPLQLMLRPCLQHAQLGRVWSDRNTNRSMFLLAGDARRDFRPRVCEDHSMCDGADPRLLVTALAVLGEGYRSAADGRADELAGGQGAGTAVEAIFMRFGGPGATGLAFESQLHGSGLRS